MNPHTLPTHPVVDLLLTARNIIADPQRWTKGAMARMPSGHPVHAWHPLAECWCASGALELAAKRQSIKLDSPPYKQAFHILNGQDSEGMVDRVNDAPATTHADVLHLYETAIAEAKERLSI